MKKAIVVMCSVCLAMGCVAQADAEDVLRDDFSREVPGRWEAAMGHEWKTAGGEFFPPLKPGEYGGGIVVADFPITEGVVEAVVRPVANRAASVGLVGKYMSRDKVLYMRVAYFQASVMDRTSANAIFTLGPFSLYDVENLDAEPEPVHLKMVMRDGSVGIFMDGVLRCVLKDPYPGEAGRPGLYAESSCYVQSFSVRRTK